MPDADFALLVAAAEGDIPGTLAALRDQANLQAVTDLGQSALHLAVWSGRREVVKTLLEAGADVSACDAEGQTPLHYAARRGGTADARDLLDHGAEPNQGNQHDTTPLHIAALAGNDRLVALLLDRDADPNAKAHSGVTPVMRCIYGDCRNAATILLSRGADFNAKTTDGNNVLHLIATTLGHAAMADFFLRAGCHVDCENNAGETALPLAIFVGNLDVARVLLAAGANPCAVDGLGSSPIHLPAPDDEMTVEAYRMLIARGANVNATGYEGDTPLHQVARRGYRKSIAYLIAQGAVLKADRQGRTPADVARDDSVRSLFRSGTTN